MANFKIGDVTHFFDKISVAIIKLDSELINGDQIIFVKDGDEYFRQEVESMQIEHQIIEQAKKGDVIGLKTADFVKAGTEVWKVN